MSTWRDLVAQIAPALDEMSADEALDAVGALEALKARAFRVALQAEAPPVKLLSVDEASEIARLPRRRLFSLSRRARAKPRATSPHWRNPRNTRSTTGRRGPCCLAKRSGYTRRNSSMCCSTRRKSGDSLGRRGR